MTGVPFTWVEARCQPGSLAGMARRGAAPKARANGREAVRPMAITDRRLRLVLAELERHARVSVNDLAASLDVSTETIRRDLKELETRGEARRVYGGAVLERKVEQPFEDRRRVQAREKARIGAAAAALVRPGTTVFVDTGTTTLAFAQHLAGREDIAVHTNSLAIADLLGRHPAANVTVTGGRLVPLFRSVFGDDTLQAAASGSYDLAVMSIGTVDAEQGFMDRGPDEAELRRVLRRRAAKSLMLVDSSKFGRPGRIATLGLTDVDVLVTDAPLKGGFAESLAASDVQVIIA